MKFRYYRIWPFNLLREKTSGYFFSLTLYMAKFWKAMNESLLTCLECHFSNIYLLCMLVFFFFLLICSGDANTTIGNPYSFFGACPSYLFIDFFLAPLYNWKFLYKIIDNLRVYWWIFDFLHWKKSGKTVVHVVIKLAQLSTLIWNHILHIFIDF